MSADGRAVIGGFASEREIAAGDSGSHVDNGSTRSLVSSAKRRRQRASFPRKRESRYLSNRLDSRLEGITCELEAKRQTKPCTTSGYFLIPFF